MASMKMTAEREEVVDFVAPYFEQTGILIVMRNPVRETSLFKFMTVLRLEVWLSILLAIVATAVMLWLLDKFSPYSAKNKQALSVMNDRDLYAEAESFGPGVDLVSHPGRRRIKYTVVKNSDTHDYFKNMKNAEDVLYQMAHLTLSSAETTRPSTASGTTRSRSSTSTSCLKGSNWPKPVDSGLRPASSAANERPFRGDFAFVHDSAEIKYEISRNCNLTEVGEVFAEQPYAIAVQQGSHLQDELSFYILEPQKEALLRVTTAKF
ncbi:hypothetical protein quinque_014910 [Culex quinquefasciatus]